MQNIVRLFFKIRNLFNTLYAGYRAKLISLSVLGIFSGFMEGVGVALLVSLFISLLGSGTPGDNFATRFLEKLSLWTNIHFSFQMVLLITCALFILKAALLFMYGRIKTRITGEYKVAIRRKIYEQLLGASFSFLRKQKLGHIDYVILADVEASAKMLESVIIAILSVSTLLTYAAVSFMLSPMITLLALTLGVFVLLVLRPLDVKLRIYSRALIIASKNAAHSMSETIMGIKSVKAFGVEQSVLKNVVTLFQENESAEIRKQDIKTAVKVSIEPVTVLFIFAVFAISYKFLTFDVTTFIPVVYLIQQIFLKVEKIQNSKNLLSGAFPHAEAVEKILIDTARAREPSFGTLPFAFNDSIQFKKVSFAYGNEDVIHDVTLSIKRGETVGIIGPSGGGKTTLVDLLLRFIDPSRGEITMDNKPVPHIAMKEWRQNIAYVAQDVFLRNDTILENIRFYDQRVSLEQAIEAAKMANIHTFIMTLPDGLHTVVGERGTRLSGGERQRIALARALARNPALLVLDEATSALDNQSETMIKDALRRLKGEMTIVIIAHRLSTMMDADRIYVLDRGAIVESGTPGALLSDPNSYFSKTSRSGSVETS